MRSTATIEGAGVHLKRAFGFQHVPRLDPFLLLDDFHSRNPRHYAQGFPWHPHRGIETITYIIEGEVEHGDSLGNSGLIGSGDVQWMTAAGGIIHQEIPKGSRGDPSLWGLQLWANLPAAEKLGPPRYRDLPSGQIPDVLVGEGARVRVIAGELQGARGPMRNGLIEPEYLDVTVPAGGRFVHPVANGRTTFAYTLQGSGSFGAGAEPVIASESLVIFGEGDEVEARATASAPFRFILVSGRPLREPVAWWGPIVMNTREELQQAFEEYERGTFLGRHEQRQESAPRP